MLSTASIIKPNDHNNNNDNSNSRNSACPRGFLIGIVA